MFILPLIFFFLNGCSCEDNPADKKEDPKNSWTKINLGFESVDVRVLKCYNNKLYLAGGTGKAIIIVSEDGSNWNILPGLVLDTITAPITALAVNDDEVYFTNHDIFLMKYSKSQVVQLTTQHWSLLGEPSDMAYFKESIFVSGMWNTYPLAKIEMNGNLIFIGDSLNPDCTKGNFGIRSSSILKLMQSRINGEDILLGSAILTNNRFLYTINKNSLNCFGNNGLSVEDKYYGVDDFVLNGDTILAGGFAVLKSSTGSGWTIIGDSLPNTPQNFKPYITAVAVYKNRIFVGTNYIGVLEWVPQKGWVKLNDGLLSFSDGFYDSVTNLIVFNNKLYAGYGKGKRWEARSDDGLYYYNLN
jgi:hypothetical protein